MEPTEGRQTGRRRTIAVAVALAAALGCTGAGVLALGQGPAPASAPAPVTVTLDIVEKQVNVLGVPFQAWTYGGTIPGHIIRITQGTDLSIVLRDGTSEVHSFHTHIQGYAIENDGASHTAPLSLVPHQADDPMSMTGTTAGLGLHPTLGLNPVGVYMPNMADDTAMPGDTVTYHYKANEVGSFVYHCHVFPAGEHIERGMFGLILVYPPGWTWNELPEKQPGVGNTAAWVTAADGTVYYEDVVVINEVDASHLTEKAGVVTTGGTGKIMLGNFRGWNDPYYIGPVAVGTNLRVVVADMGDEVHSWHLHGHNFNVLDKFDPAQRVLYRTDVMPIFPGQSLITTFTALQPGFWFAHDHIVPDAYSGMVPWLRVGV